MISDLEKTILRVAVQKDFETNDHEEKIFIWEWAISLLRKFTC